MAEAVWCLSCKTVVWAYDSQPPVRLAGMINQLGIPCPKCGEVGNFDGWGDEDAYGIAKCLATPEQPVYDDWSALKRVASMNCKDVKWEISPDCRWFHRPRPESKAKEVWKEEEDDLTQKIQAIIRNHK